jgi:uncharacterized protein
MDLTTPALFVAAFIAGTIDAIAGGGGLITLPALLYSGLAPHIALGTNKGQSTFGSLSALLNFWRAKALDRSRVSISFVCGFLGSLVGAQLVLWVSRDALKPVVLCLLVVVAALLTFRPDLGTRDGVALEARVVSLRSALVALTIGAYDGFFGPGTGTFLIMVYVAWLHDAMNRASANAKVVNFASNLAALTIFTYHGVVRWDVALPMAVAQFLGGALGARLTIRTGPKLVRRVVLLVVVLLCIKLGRDVLRLQ